MAIGSTTLVSTNMRGKLGGLFNTAENLGRFLGPVGYSITYAWSVSAPTRHAYGGWVDYRFVFYASAAVLAVVAKLAWGTLTLERLTMKPELEGGNGEGSVKFVTRNRSSPLSALYHKRQERAGVGGDEGRGCLVATVDIIV